jgi:small subunit ribosomal protein S19
MKLTWKIPFIRTNDLKKIKKNTVIKISRNSIILPKFLGITFHVYNGKEYSEITINNLMIGYKFGEFIFTRSKFIFKKKKKSKKK